MTYLPTGFRLASTTKPLTALAVMQLVEQGSLNLQDKITSHLRIAQYPRDIKVAHLLSHFRRGNPSDN